MVRLPVGHGAVGQHVPDAVGGQHVGFRQQGVLAQHCIVVPQQTGWMCARRA